MSKKNISVAKRKLAESAFDFLTKSVDEIKTHPKYAVIHFATAVELLLKARLMNEHWTLVVDKASDASLDDFLAGKCKTVTQADAIKRLENACGEMIPKETIAQFAVIAAHRNRMIHFFHDAGAENADQTLVEAIVKEQCRCWFHLERLLAQWDDQSLMPPHELAHRMSTELSHSAPDRPPERSSMSTWMPSTPLSNSATIRNCAADHRPWAAPRRVA